jgi:Repeat of unknown function (DUF5648)
LTVTPSTGYTGVLQVELTVSRENDTNENSSNEDTRTITINVGSTTLAATSNQTPADPNTTNTFTVGTFTDTNTSDTASDFTATVEFDTGVTPTTATVSGGSGTFTVNASNVYPSSGTYMAIVSVTDVATSSVILTFDTTVTVESVALPAYRLYNTILHEHLITLDANENSVLLTEPGWISEGTPFDMYAGPQMLNGVEDTPLYRLYDIVNGQHLFTADLNEYNTLRLTPGWRDEGIAGYVFLTPVTVNSVAAVEPLYRLVFGFLPDVHLFTTDTNEVSVLTSQDGWIEEDIACYVLPS